MSGNDPTVGSSVDFYKLLVLTPGVALRSTLGFMPSPAPRTSSNVSFIVFNAIRFQELNEFIPKGNFLVMRFLASYIVSHFLNV